jgi:hypothetical protein
MSACIKAAPPRDRRRRPRGRLDIVLRIRIKVVESRIPGEGVIFFSVSLPSRFGEWCAVVTAHLVERALGPVEVINADALDQFVAPAIRAKAPYIVVASHEILGKLWAALAEADKPFILAFDHPHHVLRDLVVRCGVAFPEAVRMVARSCASVTSCAALPQALVVHADRDAADPVATATAIARHFELAVDDAGIAEIVAEAADFDPYNDPQEHLAWWQGLDEWQRTLVAGAIDPYLARFAGGDLGPLTWERDFFYMTEEPPGETDPPASRPIDITGRPRHLLYGPYITLPPGSWSATVALGFSAEAAELSYIVEACAGTETVLAEVPLQPGKERVVEINLNFSLALPDMVEIRVMNERAAFDGRLALGHVVLTPADTIRPETRSYLEAVVGG